MKKLLFAAALGSFILSSTPVVLARQTAPMQTEPTKMKDNGKKAKVKADKGKAKTNAKKGTGKMKLDKDKMKDDQ